MKKRFTVPFSIILVLLFFIAGNLMAQPNIIFLSDDDNDNYNLEFLQNQGLDVTKFWGGDEDVNLWAQADLDMLSAADLVIIGRSINSGMFGDSIEAATWDNIDAPVIYNSPYHIRSSRNQMLNTTATNTITGGSMATAVLPGDEVFANVALDGEMLKWFDLNSNGIENDSAHNGTVVAQINDSVPLLVRWDAGVAFYEGSRDTADGERVYFGFGIEPSGVTAQQSHFPISKAAKQVYLNEVTRILGLPQQEAVYSAVDYSVLLLSDDENDDYNLNFLKNQGLFSIEKFWGGDDDVNLWAQADLDKLDAADLVILGRSINSGMFGDSIEAATWDNVDAPMIYVSPYHIRSSRNQMLNTTATNTIEGGSMATAVLPGDEVFANVALDGEMLKWFDLNSNGIENDSAHNGTVVAQINDSVPLLVRWDAGVAFYEGSRDAADGERVYFGFGIEPSGVTAQESHFPLSKAAKQVYLNEVTRILDIPQQEAVYSAVDYSVLFLTDWEADSNDDYNFNFLKNQGLQIQKFWVEADVNTWGADTLAMLDAAELVIIGRSVGSGAFQDSIEAATWDNIDAPIIYNSPYHIRSSRNQMLNTTATNTIDGGAVATALLPGDVVFNDVSLDGDMLKWFDLQSNGIENDSAHNGTVVAQINDSVPLLVRWDAGVAFYEGSRDTADGERVYFGFGIEPAGVTAQQSHFPLSKAAKTVYLAEIARILGFTPSAPVFSPTDITITLLQQDAEKEATQEAWLNAQGFNVVNSFYGTGNVSTWTADTIGILNNSDVVIVGRSVNSGQSQEVEDRAVWNAITAPVIWNSPYGCRNTRNNMFNSSTALAFTDDTEADVLIADDPVLEFATVDGSKMGWFVNNGDYILDNAGDNQGEWVIAQGDTIPFLVRFDADIPFYTDGPDSAVAERVYFGFGMEGAENYFPLTESTQAVYYAEIVRLAGGTITAPTAVFVSDNSLTSLSTDQGTLSPDFDPDVLLYTVDLGENENDVDVTITAEAVEGIVVEEAETTITVTGENTVAVAVTATSQLGQSKTYTVNVSKTIPGNGDGLENLVDSDNLDIYPNPFNDELIISTSEDISSIVITDLQGRVVFNQIVDGSKIELNLNNLNAGIYVIRTQVGENTYLNKITKN